MEVVESGFKMTEVGVIPSDWEIVSLHVVTRDMIQGVNTAIDIPEYVSSGIPMLKANDVIDGFIDLDNTDQVSISCFSKYTDRYKIRKHDFLFSNIGARLGTGALFLSDQKASYAWNVMRIIPNPQFVFPYYLSCYINSNFFFDQVQSTQTGSGMGFVPKNILINLKIALPPTLTEQKAIATALSDVDALISSLDKLIEKKKAIKQGAMQELLTPTKEWRTKTIKELATFRRGSFPQPYGLPKWYDNISGMPFVQVVDVDKNKRLKPETKQKISAEGAKMSVFVKKGSLILTIQGSIGRICITQYDAYVDRTLLIFESFLEDFNKYFFMISIWLKFKIEKENAPDKKKKTITKEALSSFEISYPNREEQDRIAEVLEDIEKEIFELESKKEKYNRIKQGMMQELLTGKTRLV